MVYNLSQKIRNLDKLIAKKSVLQEREKRLLSDKKEAQRDMKNTEDGLLIAQQVAKQTQNQIKIHISEMVSLALGSIFEDPYSFELDFVDKRGKTEAEMYFVRDGERINPMDASGGGAVDVASFALRIALWNIKRPKSNNTIVLDEPFRFLSKDLQPKASELLKLLSDRLGIQFIIISHNPEIIQAADKIFEVKIHKGISSVN